MQQYSWECDRRSKYAGIQPKELVNPFDSINFFVCLCAAAFAFTFYTLTPQHTTTHKPASFHTSLDYSPRTLPTLVISHLSIIDHRFTEDFNKANDLYHDNKLKDCVALARELLDDLAILRYHRMITLILLSSTLGDWHEANEHRIRAETIWHVARRAHPEGQTPILDGYMQELGIALDELEETLEDEAPAGYDVRSEMSKALRKHDEEVEKELARLSIEDESWVTSDPIASAPSTAQGCECSSLGQLSLLVWLTPEYRTSSWSFANDQAIQTTVAKFIIQE